MSEAIFTADVLPERRWSRAWTDLRFATPFYLLGCALLGVVLAVPWALGARRPGYVVSEDLTAHIGERNLAQVFAADAWYALLVAVLGVVVGIVGWLMFHRTGWWVCVLTVVGAVAGALSTWFSGLMFGQQNFAERLANASAGDLVPVDLALHAHVAILVAPFSAMTVVMLCAAFWPEPPTVPSPDTLRQEGSAAH